MVACMPIRTRPRVSVLCVRVDAVHGVRIAVPICARDFGCTRTRVWQNTWIYGYAARTRVHAHVFRRSKSSRSDLRDDFAMSPRGLIFTLYPSSGDKLGNISAIADAACTDLGSQIRVVTSQDGSRRCIKPAHCDSRDGPGPRRRFGLQGGDPRNAKS